MRVKLLRPHVIADTLRETDEELDVSVVTPYMEGLDVEAREAIRREKIRVWGRYPRYGPRVLIDDPPIPRPEGEEQPVPHIPGQR